MSLARVCLPVLVVLAAGCNCGRPGLTKAQSSLSVATDLLDFGAVPEGTSKTSKFRVDNSGKVPVTIVSSTSSTSSADFVLPVPRMTVEAGSSAEVLVVFTPSGAGEDTGTVDIVATDKPDEPELHLALHGGPIAAALTFEPDPLDFRPTVGALETKTVLLRSSGTAALTIRSVGVAAGGNPDFALIPAAVPARLLPGDRLMVRVEYARSQRDTEGLLEALSDAEDAGTRRLRLLPDPAAACGDGVDNDGDALADFPADPGCQDAQDADEYNAPSCTNGATQPCSADGGCSGTSTCANNVWGPCQGSGCGDAGCTPDGLYRIDGGALTYACCSGVVNINISAFQLTSSGRVVTPGPTQPGGALSSTLATTCPAGALDVSRVDPGGCTESYAVQGTFVGPNTFVGTYTATFTGADCTSSLPFPFGCASTPCANQSWSFTANR